MKQWMIYTRVSTEDQVQGASLEAQLAACRAMATARSWTVGPEVTDAGASGKSMQRAGARQMLEAIRSKAISGVIAWKLDRLTRSLRDLIELVQLCDANGVALVSVTESIDTSGPMGRFTVHLLGAIAQLERETISQRTKLGMAHRRAQGAHTGGITPAGLTVVVREGIKYLDTHPEHGTIVANLWPMVLDGKTLRDCGQYLSDRGMTPHKGDAWSIQTISQILVNPKYLGLLVEREVQDRVQAVLSSRASPGTRRRGTVRTMVPRPSSRVWRLHGLAVCGKCGAAMAGSQATGHGGTFAYLRCTGRLRKSGCTAENLPAVAYEDAVTKQVAGALLNADGLRAELRRIAGEAKVGVGEVFERRQALVMQRDGVQAKLNRVLDSAMDGETVARAWGPRIQALQVEVERFAVEIAALDGRLAAANIAEAECDVLMAAVTQDLQQLETQPYESQQKHLRAWVRQVRLSTEAIEAELYAPVGQVRTASPMWLPGEDSNLRPDD